VGVPTKITFTFQWSEDRWIKMVHDYLCVVLKQRMAWFFFHWLAGPCILVGVTGWTIAILFQIKPKDTIYSNTQATLIYLGLIAAWGVAVVLIFAGIRYLRKRAFHKNPLNSVPQSWTITPDNIKVTTEGTDQTFAWSTIKKVVTTQSGFWLGQGANTGIFVPIYPLQDTEQLQVFKELVYTCVAKK